MRTLLAWLACAVPALGQPFTVENKIAAAPQFVVVNRIAPPAFTAGPVAAPALPAIDFDLSALQAPAANVVPVQPVSSYSSPPGRHRHLMADGTVVEHGNQNNHQPWTPAAHAGMIQNVNGTWPQYTGPLAPQIWRP